MSQYQRLLLVADLSMQRTPAFERAVWLARTSGASLHICMFAYSSAISTVRLFNHRDGDLARDGYLDIRRGWLQAEASALRANGLNVTTEVVWAHPICEEILAHIRDLRPDVVVMDAYHESRLGRLLLTPLDWQLLRLCPVPLMLVSSLGHSVPKRIIAAVDPLRLNPEVPDFNEQIIRSALALAIQCDAELHLVHVYNALSAMQVGYSAELPLVSGELYNQLIEAQQSAFNTLADTYGVPSDRRHFLLGDAAGSIAELASKSATDVVVLGSAHRSAFGRLMVGSTTERVLSEISCSVLAIAPEAPADEMAQSIATNHRIEKPERSAAAA